jgi:hypothetical protein
MTLLCCGVGFKMIVLLAGGVGVSVLGLLAIGVAIPISESSFGNALLIAGVVILCTGLILIGMWFVGRELAAVAKLLAQGAQASPDVVSVRPSARTPAFPGLMPGADEPTTLTPGQPGNDGRPGDGVSPPWADEAASRSRPRSAPEIPPVTVDPVDAQPAPPAVPDRPARRNLLFATRRRDKADQAPTATPALESEPRVSFDNAWPTPSRPHGTTDRKDVSAGTGAPGDVVTGHAATPHAQPDNADYSSDVTVIKSGVVDGMAYTLYSDGSIEAQMVGEGLVRFASLDALRTYLDQRQ